jgi:hypothetical protein
MPVPAYQAALRHIQKDCYFIPTFYITLRICTVGIRSEQDK